MRPVTELMQRALNAGLANRRGIARVGFPQARGLVERGMAILHSRERGEGGRAYILLTATGYAAAERSGHAQDVRDYDHAEALADLPTGTVVTYRGRLTDEHCFEFIVLGRGAPSGRGYVLANREYPWSTLSQVRRSSIMPTGEQAALCPRCGHEHGYRDPADHRCFVAACGCAARYPATVPASEEATT